MDSSLIPTKIPTPFANGAVDPTYRHTVPIPSQIGVTPGAASFTDGFPPLNFQPEASGGVPPFGNDMNGLLYNVTQWLRWLMAGSPVPYDATFQTAIGGYPLGAIVASGTTARRFWVSTVENNLSNPDTGGANWQAQDVGNSGATAGAYTRPQITVDSDGRVSAVAQAPFPTRTLLTSGTGATYTTPAGATRLRILAVAGGGGTGGGSPGTGGTTTFNAVTAIGGSPGAAPSGSRIPSAGGIGGGTTGGNTGTGGGSLIIRRPGQSGAKGTGGSGNGLAANGIYFAGGIGGSSMLGAGAPPDTAGGANTGGGAGGVSNDNTTSGPGSASGAGGGGEGFELWINGPAASYTYTVGAGGTAGTSGFAGGSGYIIVEEYYD